MKAAQITTYGEPDVIDINENTPKPTLQEGQLLVEVAAASINAIDWKFRAGYLKEMAPVQLPVTLGGDFSGIVAEVSDGVSDFKVGDEVYGQAIILNGGSGSMAEFVAANSKHTALRPKSVTFEESGALPLAGVSAVQALDEHIKLQSGQKVLIHGGAGGIGHIAIQYAKSLGAYVATTVKTEDVSFAKELGADEVIDYKTQKFEEIVKEYDAVFDTVGGETADKSFEVLKKRGIFVSMLGQPNQELTEKYGVTAIGQMTKAETASLTHLAEIVAAGKIKIHIDKVFPLAQTREAFTHQEKNHPRGKVVVKIK